MMKNSEYYFDKVFYIKLELIQRNNLGKSKTKT